MTVPLKVYPKDPQAAIPFTIDWSDWLTALSDTISTSAFAVPTGITKDAQANTTTTATVKLSGGTEGSDYDVVNTITTAGGYTDERTIRIQVRQQ